MLIRISVADPDNFYANMNPVMYDFSACDADPDQCCMHQDFTLRESADSMHILPVYTEKLCI